MCSIGYCLFLIRDKWNEYLICSHAGRFFSRLTLRHVIEVESGSERFCVPKTSFQENVLVNDAIPASTKFKNKWTVSSFVEWQRLREDQVPVLDCGGLFKDYDLHKVTALSADIAGMDVLSLNYWLSKFVVEVAKKSGERYRNPLKTVYGIICTLNSCYFP